MILSSVVPHSLSYPAAFWAAGTSVKKIAYADKKWSIFGCDGMLLQWLLKNVIYYLICGNVSVDVQDIIYDSRQDVRDCVFVCLKGSRADGHDYALEVIERRARAIIVEEGMDKALKEKIRAAAREKKMTVVCVKNTGEALGEMSRAFFGYPEKKMTIIGITGTKGKTTVAGLLKNVLDRGGIPTGFIGTIGVFTGKEWIATRNTTPESYLVQKYLRMMADHGCRAAVMEVSSQALMCRRVQGMWFDYGVLTNISRDHIGPGEHSSFEDYLYWKGRLFFQCATGIVNGADRWAPQVLKNCSCRLETFGVAGDSCLLPSAFLNGKTLSKVFDWEGGDLDLQWRCGPGIRFTVSGFKDSEEQRDIFLKMPGKYNVYNALPVIAVASHMGIGINQIRAGLAVGGICGRCEMVGTVNGGALIIDYAHNGQALRSVLEALRQYHPSRLICMFGCGGNRSPLRRKDMAEAGFFSADYLIITSDNPRDEPPEQIIKDITDTLLDLCRRFPNEKKAGFFKVIPDRKTAIQWAVSCIKPGNIVLLAGKGHEMYQERGGCRFPFDEHAIAAMEIEKYGGSCCQGNLSMLNS